MAGRLRAGVCQQLENTIEKAEVPAFSSCHLPFCFTRGRDSVPSHGTKEQKITQEGSNHLGAFFS